MPSGAARRRVLRVTLVLVLALLGWQIVQLSNPALHPHDDFISSWAAGRLNVRGGNPYDADQVLGVQWTVGWRERIPYRVWYPPWILPLLMPFGVLPYTVGRVCWFAVNMAALVFCAGFLWRYYGGDARLTPLSWIVLVTFWPALTDVRTGQISALILLGLVAFLKFEAGGLAIAAGALLPLATIKPPLLHLFWVALLLWSIRMRQWGVLLAAAGSTAALLGVAAACNPAVVSQFLHMATHDAPRILVSTLGSLLRLAGMASTGVDRFWLQFVPSLFGLAWLVGHWRRHRCSWRWRERMPAILIASLVTTSYGWIYDDVVLLVPVMQIATALHHGRAHSKASTIVTSYLLLNAAILVMNVLEVDAFWYFWVPVGFLGWYATARGHLASDGFS